MKAVVEVTWLLAAIPGSQLVGNLVHLRDGSRIPVTVLVHDDTLDSDMSDLMYWVVEDGEGFASEIGN